MAHEKIVKAQVKLRFYARNGMRMTATRNLQVTATKTGQTMKTLESILDAENPNAGNKVRPASRFRRLRLPVLSQSCPFPDLNREPPFPLDAPKSTPKSPIF